MSTPTTSLSLTFSLALLLTACGTEPTGTAGDLAAGGYDTLGTIAPQDAELQDAEEQPGDPVGPTCTAGVPVVIFEDGSLVRSLGLIGDEGVCVMGNVACVEPEDGPLMYSVRFDEDYLVQIDADHATKAALDVVVIDANGEPTISGTSVTMRAEAGQDYLVQVSCDGEESVPFNLSLLAGTPQNIQPL